MVRREGSSVGGLSGMPYVLSPVQAVLQFVAAPNLA